MDQVKFGNHLQDAVKDLFLLPIKIGMDFKTVGDIRMPVLGAGTWGMGGKMEKDTSRDKENIIALKTAISLGITHIDTAELYGKGHAEKLVSQAIRDFPRESLFITTKVKGQNLGREDLLTAAERSLKRLETPYIDLYLIHWSNPNVPLKETMEAMDSLVEEGKVRHIGVSNFTVPLIKEAQEHSKNPIVANQIEYNLLVRNKGTFVKGMESEIIPYCQENNILVIAYCPIAEGMLATRDHPTLDEIAEKYKKTRTQVALNWLISKKNIVVIPKASNPEHIKENLDSIGWKLDQEDIRKLDNFS